MSNRANPKAVRAMYRRAERVETEQGPYYVPGTGYRNAGEVSGRQPQTE